MASVAIITPDPAESRKLFMDAPGLLPKLGRTLDATQHLQRWYADIAARSAVQRGLAVPAVRAHYAA